MPVLPPVHACTTVPASLRLRQRHRAVGRPGRPRTLVCGLAAIILGCSRSTGSAGESPIPPHLSIIDSVLLEETQSRFISKPNAFAVAPNGDYYVADAAEATIMHFAHDGRWIRTIGRKGSGPGEFQIPAFFRIVDDTLLAVLDQFRRVVTIDILRDSVIRVQAIRGFLTSLDGRRDTLVLGSVNPGDSTTFGVLGSSDTTQRRGGPYLDLFRRVPQSASVFGQVVVLATQDRVLTAYEPSNHVYLSDWSGTVIDSIAIPIGSRRGARLDLFSRVVAGDAASAQAAVYQSSLPIELIGLPENRVAIIYLDQRQEHNRIVGPLSLAVFDLTTHRACADTLLPLPSDPIPRGAFRDDTLVTLYQDVTPSGTPTLWIKRFLVSAGDCLSDRER